MVFLYPLKTENQRCSDTARGYRKTSGMKLVKAFEMVKAEIEDNIWGMYLPSPIKIRVVIKRKRKRLYRKFVKFSGVWSHIRCHGVILVQVYWIQLIWSTVNKQECHIQKMRKQYRNMQTTVHKNFANIAGIRWKCVQNSWKFSIQVFSSVKLYGNRVEFDKNNELLDRCFSRILLAF